MGIALPVAKSLDQAVWEASAAAVAVATVGTWINGSIEEILGGVKDGAPYEKVTTAQAEQDHESRHQELVHGPDRASGGLCSLFKWAQCSPQALLE